MLPPQVSEIRHDGPSPHGNDRSGPSAPRFEIGERVRSNVTGEFGAIERRHPQRHTDDLYRVFWDELHEDDNWYAEGRLVRADEVIV